MPGAPRTCSSASASAASSTTASRYASSYVGRRPASSATHAYSDRSSRSRVSAGHTAVGTYAVFISIGTPSAMRRRRTSQSAPSFSPRRSRCLRTSVPGTCRSERMRDDGTFPSASMRAEKFSATSVVRPCW